MIFAYITFPSKASAKKISQALLKKRLAACVNIFPIESAYWWKGKIENAKEFVAIAKTEKRLFAGLEREIGKMHPYKVPFIGMLDVSKVNREYEKWLCSELRA